MFQDHPDARARRDQLSDLHKHLAQKAREAADAVCASTNPARDGELFVRLFVIEMLGLFAAAKTALGPR